MAQPLVNSETIQDFLQRLGQCYRHSGTVYLVGGSSLLLAAAKESTFDIDLHFEVPAEHQSEFIECLRRLSRQTQLPVEQVSPGEFLPLPAGYGERRRYIGRFGQLELFHFDFYSVALSKLMRGNEKDFTDVISLVQTGIIALEKLEQYFEEILPKVDAYNLRADSQDFMRKFALFKERLAN